jgi:hypothetical protein
LAIGPGVRAIAISVAFVVLSSYEPERWLGRPQDLNTSFAGAVLELKIGALCFENPGV